MTSGSAFDEARRPSTGRRALAVSLLIVVLAVTAGGLLRLRYDTSIATFLPPHDSARQAYAVDQRAFGSDPITVLIRRRDHTSLITTALVPELIRTEGELARLPHVKAVYGPGTILNQLAASAQNLLTDISFKRQEIARAAEQQASARGLSARETAQFKAAALQAFDLRYGALLTRALPAGLPTLGNDAFLHAIAFSGPQPRPTLRFVLPDTYSAVIAVRPAPDLDETQVSELVRGVRLAVAKAKLGSVEVTTTGSPVVLASLVKQSRLELPKLSLVALGVVLALLVLGARGERGLRHWTVSLIPLLAAGIAVLVDLAVLGWLDQPASLVLIAVLPALIGVGSDVPIYLDRFGPTRAVLATTLATAAGFATAALSPVPFLAQLGWLLAVGVIVAASVAYLLNMLVGNTTDEPVVSVTAPREHVTARRARGALAALGVVALVGWVLLPSVPLKADLAGLAGGLPVERDARLSSSVLGVSGQLDVLLVGNTTTPAALRWTAEARDAVISEHGDQLRPVLSLSQLLEFLGSNPTPQQIQAGLAALPDYLVHAVLSADGSTSQMSFAVVPGDVQQQRTLIDRVQRSLPAPPAGSRVSITGLPAGAAQELRLLNGHRVTSNLLGILAPSVILLLLLGWRRRGVALRALLAAAVATGLGLFVLELAGVALTPLTLALGSLTAAVGCEFSVVLQQQVGSAWRSVLLAGGTSVAGYAALCASQLTVMRNFSLVLASSVAWAALAACLVALAFPSRRIAQQAMNWSEPADRAADVQVTGFAG